jgi:hypothetical protein
MVIHISYRHKFSVSKYMEKKKSTMIGEKEVAGKEGGNAFTSNTNYQRIGN